MLWHRRSRESTRSRKSNRASHQAPPPQFLLGQQLNSQGLTNHWNFDQAPLPFIPPVTNWNLLAQAPVIGTPNRNDTLTTILSSWCSDLHAPPQLNPAHASNVFEWTPSPAAGQYVVVPGLLRHHTASGQPIQEAEIFYTQPAIYRVITTTSHFMQPVLQQTLQLRTVSRPPGGTVFPPSQEITIEFSTLTL